MDYENPWTFDDKPFTNDDVGNYEGFVYLITNKLDGRRYIGRKYFWERRKNGKKRRSKSPSNWKDYYGSSKNLLTDVEKYGKINFKREIMSLHITRGDCNKEEVRQQFFHNVLEEEGWYNESIGKYRSTPVRIYEGRRTSRLSRTTLSE